jgi:hypothetical protein
MRVVRGADTSKCSELMFIVKVAGIKMGIGTTFSVDCVAVFDVLQPRSCDTDRYKILEPGKTRRCLDHKHMFTTNAPHGKGAPLTRTALPPAIDR